MSHAGMGLRRLAALAAALIGLLGGAEGVVAQEFLMEDITVQADRSINVQRIQATHPFDLQGYSLSITYDPALYEIVSVGWQGSSVDEALGGNAPGFWVGRFDPVDPGSIVVACVLHLTESRVLPATEGDERSSLAVVKYRIRPLANQLGATIPSMYYGAKHPAAPGSPGVENNMTTEGVSITPTLQDPIRLNVFGNVSVPPAPLSLEQVGSGGVLPAGSRTSETSLTLRAQVSDPAGAPLVFRTEVKPVGVPFSGAVTAQAVSVPSGSVASVLVHLDSGSYRWRAWTVSTANVSSPMAAFGSGDVNVADLTIADADQGSDEDSGSGGGGGGCGGGSAQAGLATMPALMAIAALMGAGSRR